MDAMVAVSAGLYGLCLGSFLNVVVWRLPRGESLVSPGSHCPRCGRPIAWFDNIPVVSFLALRGRCRHCHKKISARYPLVEATTAALCVLMVWRWLADGWWAVIAALSAAFLFAITLIDWETFLIPDPLSLGLLILGLASAPLNPMFSGGPLSRLLEAAAGAALGFGMTWLTAELGERAFKKEALGGGDIKLLAAVGAVTGPAGAFTTLMLGSAFGAAYGIWQMSTGKLERQDPIPFGPFLSLGALIVLLDLLPRGFPLFLTPP